MHAKVLLNTNHLRTNYQQICSVIGESRMAPVLKSNAYGHGLKEIYDVVAEFSPKYICTNYLEEAEALRSYGYQGRILNVGPSFSSEFEKAYQVQAEILLTSMDLVKEWMVLKNKPAVHIKFDTGMSRQGLFSQEASEVLKVLEPFKDLVKGVCTHFANVEDVLDYSYADRQMEEFTKVRDIFSPWQKDGLIFHASSSASGFLLKDARFDLVRVGISLYGFWPSGKTKISFVKTDDQKLELKPVLSFVSKISQIKMVEAGRSVGYGCHFKTMRDTKVAVVSVGYNEGLPRLADRGYLLVNGKRCPILGRICMNMTMIDVSDVASCKVGDQVVIIGSSGKEILPAEEIAEWAQTIHYEIVTRINPLIERVSCV